ncbi:hypothetical protein ACH4GP_28555 [Streptomyces celluloflavus]|uniref:Uncharacterized protein n=1 Tax=Streptomyces celluloflavus TaxID=58344 RepID=A0ABW7RJR4_9ACTN
MTEVHEFVKRYGTGSAVQHMSCGVRPGQRGAGVFGPHEAGGAALLRMFVIRVALTSPYR